MTEADFRMLILESVIANAGGVRQLAVRLGCSPSYVSIGVVGETLLNALLRCRRRLARVTEDWVPRVRRKKPGPPYTLKQAQRLRVCRVCGKGETKGPGLPFLYDYGREYAHQKCLR